MKTKLSIGNLSIGEIKLENISIEQEYTATDALQLLHGGKNFVKELIKDLPEMLGDLEVAFNEFNEIEERCNCYYDTYDTEEESEEDILKIFQEYFSVK